MRLRGARLCLIIKKSLLTDTRVMFNFQHQLRSAVNGSLTGFVLKDVKGVSQVRDKVLQLFQDISVIHCSLTDHLQM